MMRASNHLYGFPLRILTKFLIISSLLSRCLLIAKEINFFLISFSPRHSSIPGASARTEVVAELEFKEARENPIQELVKGLSLSDTVLPNTLVVAMVAGKCNVTAVGH